MLSYTDTALLTFEDEQALFGDMFVEQCIERTSEAGVSEIAIKRGAKDCLVIVNDQANYVAPKPVDNIIDTTAAGDSFSAGYLAKRLNWRRCSKVSRNGSQSRRYGYSASRCHYSQERNTNS